MNVDSLRYLGVCGTLKVLERLNDVGERPKVSGEQVLFDGHKLRPACWPGLPFEGRGRTGAPFLMLGPMVLSKGSGLGQETSQVGTHSLRNSTGGHMSNSSKPSTFPCFSDSFFPAELLPMRKLLSSHQ